MRAVEGNHTGRCRRSVRSRWPRTSNGLGALLLLFLLLFLLPTTALAVERVKSFGPDGTSSSNFERVSSIAIDEEEESIYVLDAFSDAMFKFGLSGEPLDFGGTSSYIEGNRINGLELREDSQPSSQVAVAPNSHLIYVTEEHAVRAFQANGEPAEFTAGPGEGTSKIPGFGKLYGVAVDASGNIYASDYSGTVSVFEPSGAPLTSFSASQPSYIAVDSTGAVHVLEETVAVRKFTPDALPVTTTTTYSATAVIEREGHVFLLGFGLDPSNNDVYIEESNFNQAWINRYDALGVHIEWIGKPGTPGESEVLGGLAKAVAVLGEAKEVAEGETIKLYAADSTPESSKVTAFGSKTVIGPPEIENTSALDVTSDTVTLRAWVDPNTSETTYRFEYGLQDCALSDCTSVPLGGASAGDGEEPVEVTEAISGLAPDTTYHYRVVAENSLGPPTEGPVRTFTTQPLGLGFELADSRAWEMVSPPNKHGGQLRGSALGLIQAADDGEGLAYLSLGSIEPNPEGNRAFEMSSILARRGAAGWSSKDITAPNHRAIQLAAGSTGEYKLFDPGLSRAVLEPRDGAQLSPQASERTPYLWEDAVPPVFTPLVTGKEGFANVPPGTEFGGNEGNAFGLVQPVGATPDLGRVVLSSSAPLTEAAAPPGHALYVWTDAELRQVSALPAGEGEEIVQGTLGSGSGTVQNAVAADGSRIFWSRGLITGANSSLTALYMRDTLAEETVRLDVEQPGATGAGQSEPFFQGASADGTVVFFSDSRQLTPDASPSGRDLYRCEIPAGSPATGCASLTDISAPLVGSGESAEVLGLASGLSEDGTRIYFVARGELDTAPNQSGESAIGGEPNLYLWQEGQGVRFIATLAAKDKGTSGVLPVGSDNLGLASSLNADASPSGRYLSFMSQRSLTGYANIGATSGEPVQEVFRYDAAADQLECISCNPFGAAPRAERPKSGTYGLIDPNGQYQALQVAAALPAAAVTFEGGVSLYRPRTALDNGRVFFNAFDSLVPADSNGEWDAYQYEPTGVGDCTASSGDAATVRSAGGCVSLLSSGTAEGEAAFLDASESGEDAFFLTPARLAVTDEDEDRDVYDARVDGVPPVLAPRPECQGEACQPAAVMPSDPTPGTATFVGPGDRRSSSVKRCPKGKRKIRRNGKARCVRRKHRPHRRQSRKPSQTRRAGR